jgi:hypothetical protein
MKAFNRTLILVVVLSLLLTAGAKKPPVDEYISGEFDEVITIYGEGKGSMVRIATTAAQTDAQSKALPFVHAYVEKLLQTVLAEANVEDENFLEQAQQVLAIYGVFEKQENGEVRRQTAKGRIPGSKIVKTFMKNDDTYAVQMDIEKKDIRVDLLTNMHTREYIDLFHYLKEKSETFQKMYVEFREAKTDIKHIEEHD